MSSKQQIEKDREKIAELYKIIREKKHNYDLAIEALLIASKYLNKADNQRMELALLKPYEEIVRCSDCKFDNKCTLQHYWQVDGFTEEIEYCSLGKRSENGE